MKSAFPQMEGGENVKFSEVKTSLKTLTNMGMEARFRGVEQMPSVDFRLLVGGEGEGPLMGFADVASFENWLLEKRGPIIKEYIFDEFKSLK